MWLGIAALVLYLLADTDKMYARLKANKTIRERRYWSELAAKTEARHKQERISKSWMPETTDEDHPYEPPPGPTTEYWACTGKTLHQRRRP